MTTNELVSYLIHTTPEWLVRPGSIGYPILRGPGEEYQGGTSITTSTGSTPPMEKQHKVDRADGTVKVTVKLPGFKKEEISVWVDPGCLHVKATSEDPFVGTFEDKIPVHESTTATAEFKDGLLTITLELANKKKEVLIN